MTLERFGYLPDGRAVERFTLSNGTLTANILSLGAIVQDLRLAGVAHPLVLGSDRLGPYLGSMQYFGAIVGRYANRIAGARFTLDGQEHHLSRNALGRHCLHGGARGSSAQIWTIAVLKSDQVSMRLTLPDGDMGFPGTLDIELGIALNAAALEFDIRARSDKTTLCNFTHHGFFILDGSGSIAQHCLQLDATTYLPVDPDQIPTGERAAVAGSGLDFRSARSLCGMVLDHNFCLSDQRSPRRPVARLESAISGIRLQMDTTEPGLQVYTANHLPKRDVRGLEGRHYRRHAGIALEAQIWPDAPNQRQFPSAVLPAGDVYHQQTRYTFDRWNRPEPTE